MDNDRSLKELHSPRVHELATLGGMIGPLSENAGEILKKFGELGALMRFLGLVI
jgi:hypothetical protein